MQARALEELGWLSSFNNFIRIAYELVTTISILHFSWSICQQSSPDAFENAIDNSAMRKKPGERIRKGLWRSMVVASSVAVVPNIPNNEP